MLQFRLQMHSYSSLSQICCFSRISPSCRYANYLLLSQGNDKNHVLLQNCTIYLPTKVKFWKLVRFWTFLAPIQFGQKLDIQKFSALVLVGIGQKILGKWHLYSKLLTKLQLHGIDTSWYSAYLSGHTQSVSFRDNVGDVKQSVLLGNNIGIFQGSALGTLLYSIFANDLSLFAEDATIVQYADDTQILVSGSKFMLNDITDRMENVLTSLDIWFRHNGLKVNADKS